MAMKFRVILSQDEDGVFVAECPTLPGCISQGKTHTEREGTSPRSLRAIWPA
jgi:predicted RNase H-like HicB family nuclease